MKITTLALTERDVKAIKVALEFALEFAPTEVKAHMQGVLNRFNNLVFPSRTKH
jgi:hypothetical protein